MGLHCRGMEWYIITLRDRIGRPNPNSTKGFQRIPNIGLFDLFPFPFCCITIDCITHVIGYVIHCQRSDVEWITKFDIQCRYHGNDYHLLFTKVSSQQQRSESFHVIILQCFFQYQFIWFHLGWWRW